MTKYVTFICIILLMAAGVHAGLNTPSLLNPSFEADTLAAGAKQTAVSDWWNRTQYGGVIEETASGVPETPYGSNWGEMGNQNWFYQQIGTWEANMDIDISFLIGSISGKTFSGLYISLWAGGNPALAANSNSQTPTLESAVVATQIAISDLVKPALAASDSAEITLSLSTGETGTVGEPLWLQIRAAGAQRTLIDNVSVELPTTAVLVSPANNEPRAEIDSELKWNAPPIGVVDHYVLYHRQGDPNFSDAGTTVVDPATSPYTGLGTMPYATQYYWRVDVVNDSAETITGKVWNFTTAPEVPQIDEQPVGVLVPGDVTENATFTVTGLNIVNHKWQKDGSPLSDGGKISGSSTDTLTVAGVTQADEGLYSCVVDNNKGDSDETTQAVLMTERLVAHYAFDNDLTDSQGNLNTGVVIDPNALDANVPDVGYDTGIVGDGALSLGANLGVEGYQLGFVKIPGSEDALRFNHLG
ncbi:MAG: hypothetical protein KAS23_15775, partial [Anaerohalosphaera sp.]|nr:hypothetical protein [Anaerohalosphaera sp.]